MLWQGNLNEIFLFFPHPTTRKWRNRQIFLKPKNIYIWNEMMIIIKSGLFDVFRLSGHHKLFLSLSLSLSSFSFYLHSFLYRPAVRSQNLSNTKWNMQTMSFDRKLALSKLFFFLYFPSFHSSLFKLLKKKDAFELAKFLLLLTSFLNDTLSILSDGSLFKRRYNPQCSRMFFTI